MSNESHSFVIPKHRESDFFTSELQELILLRKSIYRKFILIISPTMQVTLTVLGVFQRNQELNLDPSLSRPYYPHYLPKEARRSSRTTEFSFKLPKANSIIVYCFGGLIVKAFCSSNSTIS